MSVVVTRDPTTADQLVFLWSEPIPWGAELVCAEGEVAVICPDWTVGEQLGPGRHTVSPTNPASHLLAYFVRTTPVQVPFDNVVGLFDRATGNMVQARYSGYVTIQISDPKLLCSNVIGVPSHDLSSGILRSASNSVNKALHVMILKALGNSPTVTILANSVTVAQVVKMTANGNPMAIAVNGVEFLRFEQVSLSLDGNAPIRVDTDALGDGIAADASVPPGEEVGQPFAVGAQVLVYGNDGLWHAATVRQFRDGGYEVAIEGFATVTWVQGAHVRAAQ